ncbi:hypothetical protein EYF80_019506 [Liparis tanakae]|uniref:Uncharacterized protein n=1 Tax=Liparis tanakae TaxID=230148 RepID=A0A4Z2HZB1_9TELE|nr:hypothetical protein EYF80_019506 [Liparis tanakae]
MSRVGNLYFTYELGLQFAERGEVQAAGGSQPGQLLLAVLGLLHGVSLPAADVVPRIQRRLGLRLHRLRDGEHGVVSVNPIKSSLANPSSLSNLTCGD